MGQMKTTFVSSMWTPPPCILYWQLGRLPHGVHHQTLRISILSLLLTLKGCNGFKNIDVLTPHTITHKPYQPIKYEPNLYGNLLEFLILPLNSLTSK